MLSFPSIASGESGWDISFIASHFSKYMDYYKAVGFFGWLVAVANVFVLTAFWFSSLGVREGASVILLHCHHSDFWPTVNVIYTLSN